MLRVKPFTALRPVPDLAASVASVPYDVVNTAEARALADGNEHSFLHVIRPDIDLPNGTDQSDDVMFNKARTNFAAMRAQGVFDRDELPKIYLYRQSMELLGTQVSQTGVVACCHIEDYTNNLIKKHEKTRKAKEDQRTRHVLELNANAEPVFFMHRGERTLESLIERDAQGEPIYDFVAPDGVRHTVWIAPASAPYVDAYAKLDAAYVADGHHRTASAARAGAELRAENAAHTGEEEYNWFLAVLFPSDELSILPYHRVVKDLHGLDAGAFITRLADVGEVTPSNAEEAASVELGSVCVYAADSWHKLTFPAESIPASDPIASLDYVVLSERVLEPVLGIGDVRTDERIDFVGGIRGPKELERRVDSGEVAVGFAMAPVTVQQIMDVADAGEIMPPKCTWFEPKLRSGLLIHLLD
ncbi:MAG: DUF1015 family protein [Planctomycetota bacterium]